MYIVLWLSENVRIRKNRPEKFALSTLGTYGSQVGDDLVSLEGCSAKVLVSFLNDKQFLLQIGKKSFQTWWMRNMCAWVPLEGELNWVL